MKKGIFKNSNQKGSLMVEALALLGLITMVTPVLYKKAAERTTELQDINVATQMRMVSSAVDDFLRDHYKTIGGGFGSDNWDGEILKLEEGGEAREALREYLPHGFDVDKESKMFDKFDISVRRRQVTDANGNVHNVYTSAVLAPVREDLSRMRSSKIASMVGANGGVYRSEEEDDLQGVQGSWSAKSSDYGFDMTDVQDESLVIVSSQAIASAKGDVSSDDVLYRISDGDIEKNTMQTTLYMGGYDVKGLANLIAKEDTITIGDDGADGADNLVVTGLTTLKNTLTVTGNLTQSGGQVDFDGDSVNIQARDVARVGSGAAPVLIDGGQGVFLSAGGAPKLEITTGSNTFYGDTKFTNSSDVTIDYANLTLGRGDLSVAGSASVTGSTSIGGDLTVSGNTTLADTSIYGDLNIEGDLSADIITANNKFRLADDSFVVEDGEVTAESVAIGENLYADSSGVVINNNKFSVGGADKNASNKININSTASFMGHAYNSGISTAHGFISQSGSNRIQTVSDSVVKSKFYATSSNTYLSHYDANAQERAKLLISSAGKVTLTSKDENGKSRGLISLSDGGSLQASISDEEASTIGTLTIRPDYTYLMRKDIENDEDTYVMFNEHGMSLGGKSTVYILDKSAPETLGDSLFKYPTSAYSAKVGISRQGIIEVKAPDGVTDKGGYIKARRLVSDVPYRAEEAFHGFEYTNATIQGSSDAHLQAYDYYQVNPAYTSVMNDIKLATRGGARLSDILPDFINKGIYVVDNTYKDTSIPGWEGADPDTLESGAQECDTNVCVTSPWMGFVPAPQCPKHYAKVITLNPIRWRMSEVYAVYDIANFPTDQAAYKEFITGTDASEGLAFRQKFHKVYNPKNAELKLSVPQGGDINNHTHLIEGGVPLTFQTNTWLNTTISNYYTSGTDVENFKGWHTVMGFVYRPTQYTSLLQDMGLSTDPDNVYWNVFPVYAQDMAAIANVYCYFDRNPLIGGTRTWRWGNDSPVYKYDQLNNYHQGYEKDASWDAQVNDPDLGYQDAW